MYRNSKKPMYPCHDCCNKTNSTETELVQRRRSNSSDRDFIGSISDNKLFRNRIRSKSRCADYYSLLKDQEKLGSYSSSRQRFDDIILVNITDQHTANANSGVNEQKKMKKGSKSCKNNQKSSQGPTTNSKPLMRVKHSIKENSPNYVGKGKKGVIVKCSCKIQPKHLIDQKTVEETIKSALLNEEDPIKNALQLTNQIKSNIDSIRAQSNKQCSLRGLPQSKFAITSKETRDDNNPNSSSVTAPYLQQLRNEINANRYCNTKCQPSCIPNADQDILNLRNEILQYKLKSEEDLPQAMVIEVSYINNNKDDEATDKNVILSKKCASKCDKHTECGQNCKFTLTDYNKITEKPVIDESRPNVTKNKLADIEESSIQQSSDRDSYDSAASSNNNPVSQLKGIVRVSIKDKNDSKDSRKKKRGTPGTEDGDSTGHAFDDLDADTVDSIDEERHKCCQDECIKPPRSQVTKKSISSRGAHENTILNKRLSNRKADSPPEKDSFVNESFILDQIAGMKKIDKLVEEAEQSISKVVERFDKFFKDPNINADPSMDSDSKRKDLKFDIDDSCDCAEDLRCDCEEKMLNQESFLGRPFSPATTEPISDTDHLNTISERTESIAASPPNSQYEIRSVVSDISFQNEVPLSVKNIKKDARISIDTRNIVHIAPTTKPIEKTPLLQEAGTETDNIKNRVKTNVLEIQNMPGIEILSSFVVQKIYNINIQPTSSFTNAVNVPNNKNTFFIELKHDDPVIVQMVGFQQAPYLDNKDNGPTEINVIKAPVPNQESIIQTQNHKIGKTCRHCINTGTSTPENKEKIVDELLDDIRDFQIPMGSTVSLDAKSNTSSVSEYIEVQDNSTQVSFIKTSRDDRVQTTSSKSCIRQNCGFTRKGHPEQIKTFASTENATSTETFSTNMRPPIPGFPIGTYQPIPYDKEEVSEIEIFNKSMQVSDDTPFNLSKGADSRIIDVEEAQCTPKFQDSLSCGNRHPIKETKTTEEEDTITFQPVKNQNVNDNHFMLAPVNFCGSIKTSCPMETTVRVVKPDNLTDINDLVCLANAYDFNAACEDNISNAGINLSCDRKTARADQMAINKTANDEQMPIKLIGIEVGGWQCSDACEGNSESTRFERPVSFATEDIVQEISCEDLTAIDTSNITPTVNIEGVQIMESTYEYAPLQDLYRAPHPDREPPVGPTNPNPTAMSAMIQYDQRGVNESLRQNLLLAQLKDDVTLVSCHKPPIACMDSSTSEMSSNSSGDYPERNKYLMRAKRRQLSHQRGIVTEDPDDFILSRSPGRYDTLSDGEMSHYTTSTGEMLPIGPRLLRDRNFMRRRPDRVFQMELNQRNMHIHRQHNYFNNWVSYYVTDKDHL